MAQSTSGTQRRGQVARAATVLPLAIGLASGPLSRSESAPEAPEAEVSHARRPARASAGGGSGAFHPACQVAFDAIKEPHPIDDSCGAGGKATAPNQVAQNDAKNNFCANGAATALGFKDFDALQRAAEGAGVTFGSASKVPDDRGTLTKLLKVGGRMVGEGDLVKVGAFVHDAHYSNVQKGESVNCNVGGDESNDIHIVLVETASIDDPCLSVTAEISPHFRPEVWSPETLNALSTRKLRFTGQLFFDASHQPCDNQSGTRENPPRRALFEVHPVYAIDVCGTGAGTACDPSSEAGWVALDRWVGNETEEKGE